MLKIRLVFENFLFAWKALVTNPLRSILSLTSVCIGILVIIGVYTFVDSLEKSLKDSFSFLGANVLYIEQWPFIGSADFPWWEYIQRPRATYEEFQYLDKNATMHDGICVFAINDNTLVSRANSSISRVVVFGTTYGYKDVFDFDLESGRYFSIQEINNATNSAIIGVKIKEQLFGDADPIGEFVKIRGAKYQVIGVFEEQGENLLDTPSNDITMLVPFNSLRKIFHVGTYDGLYTRIALRGLDSDQNLDNLKGELMGLMRKKRGLKPKEKKNFELNEPEAIANEIGKIFQVFAFVGTIIGMFSILIGGFGIANIMFVSVKERTGLIGVQKSLGAKKFYILIQFLFEATFLCLIGGLIGLFFVYLLTFIPLGNLVVTLTMGNIVKGLSIVIFIGILFGIIPAIRAANLDPVEAIREN